MRIQQVANEFKTFILKGNVVDLAVGVVIGAAFGKVVDSLVKDIITPFLGMFGRQPQFEAMRLGPLAIGSFFNSVLAFLIIGAVIFFLVVKPLNTLMALAKRKAEAQSPEAAPLPDDVKLLMEIRDLLKERRGGIAGQ